jgi:hypothetical protein
VRCGRRDLRALRGALAQFAQPPSRLLKKSLVSEIGV